MSKKLRVKFKDIKESPLFVGVKETHIKRATKYCFGKKYEAGETIIKEGEAGDFMFIVLDGKVDVLKGKKNVKLATLGKGVFVGEGALVSKAPRNATVKANGVATVAVFDQKGFDKLSTLHPAIPATMMKVHNERCKDTVKKMNVYRSKQFIPLVVIGLLMFIKNGGALLPMIKPFTDFIGGLIPNELMALGGPGYVLLFLKLKKMETSEIVAKLEKI